MHCELTAEGEKLCFILVYSPVGYFFLEICPARLVCVSRMINVARSSFCIANN